MEGGGQRKRKAGPIALDWNKLLPSGHNDDEPPPVVEIEGKAEKSKPLVEVTMEGGGEESNEYIQKMSDKDLIEKITRLKNNLGRLTSILPDGGEKYRVSLKSHEAELERRKLLKDDDCKKGTTLPDESTCTGASDDLSPRGVPPSSPASQSTFALHFCSKLDDKGPTKSFSEELSTLNSSGCKSRRENGSFLTQKTQKTGLSSRQAPFKSPSHLSVKNDECLHSSGGQLGSHSSTASPHQSDKDVSGCFLKKENAPRFQPTVNTRRNKKTVVLLDEEELEVDVINQADQVGQSSEETRIYYPSRDDPEAVEICCSDMECLAPESFLSSIIMNFYIRYLQKPTSPRARSRCDYHFFNTYFYEKLKRDVLNKTDKESSFVKFRRWWKGVNIFEKAYIFLPINENLHWSLVIICIPNKEDESGPIILHLDSLGLHSSKLIFNDVKSFLIEEWKFLRKEDLVPELPIADNIWDKLSRRIDEKVIEVPQQRNEYDCGLFVLFFMERFIEEAPERLKKKDLDMFGKQWFKPEEASSLRRKISDLLREEFKECK
ncbi:Ubiquitin-like-specific protease 1D [Sesamum alatum]|uniref:Ubiquitin-like-specific protease 1D n=1 Tax=Sesamum alatum TaxID=300844 RepID=A0AAE2CPK7_9LAMI|nr:Ubiquitin-like-specific protease 1D [Sesamum alatum]